MQVGIHLQGPPHQRVWSATRKIDVPTRAKGSSQWLAIKPCLQQPIQCPKWLHMTIILLMTVFGQGITFLGHGNMVFGHSFVVFGFLVFGIHHFVMQAMVFACCPQNSQHENFIVFGHHKLRFLKVNAMHVVHESRLLTTTTRLLTSTNYTAQICMLHMLCTVDVRAGPDRQFEGIQGLWPWISFFWGGVKTLLARYRTIQIVI